MAGISASGIGSGLDINGLVTQLIAAERRPTDIRLDVRETEYQARLSSFGILRSSLSSFQGALSTLSSSSSFQGRSTSSSDTDVLAVTSSVVATPGDYAVTVNDLARAHKLASSAFSESSDTVGTGELTIRFGSYNTDETSFAVNADVSAITFTIDSNNASLQGIRDTINAANKGVTATIVNDDEGYKLVLASQNGVEYGMEVTVDEGGIPADNLDSTGLSQLVFTDTTKNNISSSVKAQDANITIDGLTISRSSNVIADAINGITLDLKQLGVADVSISLDKAGTKSNVEAYVGSFNGLMGAINALTQFDADKGEGSILMGDATVRSLTSQMRNITSNLIDGVGGTLRTLADIGISLNSTNGLLEYDADKLQSALDNNFSEVAALFAAIGTSSDALVQYISSGDKTEVGLYDINISQLSTKGYYNGNGVLPDFGLGVLTIDGDNDNFTVKIDGIVSDTISLTNGDYSSGANIAAELQSQINADENLIAQGVSVSVDYDSGNDRLVITSNRYGSASSIDFQTIDSNMALQLGLVLGSTTDADGKDVAGTINGVAAAGSGQFLTGAVDSDAEGLKLLISGGSTGTRGSINFTRGYADQLNTLLDTFLKADGSLDAKMDGLQGRIDNVGEQREDLNRRIEALEIRYRAQFNALDALMAQLQSTSSFLTQQLVGLENLIKRK